MKTTQDKVNILRAKQELRKTKEYHRVYIRSSQSNEERLFRSNMETILGELPNRSRFRFTGNGRLIRKDEERDEYRRQDAADFRDERPPHRTGERFPSPRGQRHHQQQSAHKRYWADDRTVKAL